MILSAYHYSMSYSHYTLLVCEKPFFRYGVICLSILYDVYKSMTRLQIILKTPGTIPNKPRGCKGQGHCRVYLACGAHSL